MPISTQTAPFQRVQIAGTKGRIEVEIPFNAPPDKPNRYFVQGMAMNEGKTHALPVSDQYQLQAEAFNRVIRGKEKAAYGVKESDIKPEYIKPNQAGDKLKDGALDAFCCVGGAARLIFGPAGDTRSSWLGRFLAYLCPAGFCFPDMAAARDAVAFCLAADGVCGVGAVRGAWPGT